MCMITYEKNEKTKIEHFFLAKSPEQCSSPIDDPSMMSEPILPRCPFIDDSNVMSIDESSTSLPSESPLDHSLNNSARITAIRELIETEERYVHDLHIVDRDFIKPLNNGKILNDYEVDQLFSNWYSLIACNCIFLSKLQEHIKTSELSMSDEILYLPAVRSASMFNISSVKHRNLYRVFHRYVLIYFCLEAMSNVEI